MFVLRVCDDQRSVLEFNLGDAEIVANSGVPKSCIALFKPRTVGLPVDRNHKAQIGILDFSAKRVLLHHLCTGRGLQWGGQYDNDDAIAEVARVLNGGLQVGDITDVRMRHGSKSEKMGLGAGQLRVR